MDVLEFTVPGHPIPKERPRGGERRFYTPRETHEAEDIVGSYAYKGRGRFLEGELRLDCVFYFATRRCGDFDNLLKLVGDALQRCGVIRNDKQIKSGSWDFGDVETLRQERTDVKLSRR